MLDLQILIKRFCQLSNGTETDLLEVSDEIMASLNFLICMLIRDKENVLKIWNIIEDLENNFLKPLDKGLSMSRAHYKLKLDESKRNHPHFIQKFSNKIWITFGYFDIDLLFWINIILTPLSFDISYQPFSLNYIHM